MRRKMTLDHYSTGVIILLYNGKQCKFLLQTEKTIQTTASFDLLNFLSSKLSPHFTFNCNKLLAFKPIFL